MLFVNDFIFFFSSPSYSSLLLYLYSYPANTWNGYVVPVPAANYPRHEVTGPTRAETAKRDSNEGQDRGAGGREEEGDGWEF